MVGGGVVGEGEGLVHHVRCLNAHTTGRDRFVTWRRPSEWSACRARRKGRAPSSQLLYGGVVLYGVVQ